MPLVSCCCLARAFGICGGDPGTPGVGGRETELSGSEVFLLLILPLKGSRKENGDTFSPPVALHKNRVICLNGYRVAEVWNGLSAS